MTVTRIITYKTTDYSMFKVLHGNRSVEPGRVAKIKNSIKTVGYIPNSIIVNEKLEVIDGQGRLQALKELKLPVYYQVVNGIGINECRAMNINQTNWSTLDFAKSYAEEGNQDYQKLLRFITKFQPFLSLNTIVAIGAKTANSIGSKVLKNGSFKFKCSDVDAENECEYLMRYQPFKAQLPGSRDIFFAALLFCYRDPAIDENRMLAKLTRYSQKMSPFTTIDECLDSLEVIYNIQVGTRSKVYFHPLYDDYVDDLTAENKGLREARKSNPTYRRNRMNGR